MNRKGRARSASGSLGFDGGGAGRLGLGEDFPGLGGEVAGDLDLKRQARQAGGAFDDDVDPILLQQALNGGRLHLGINTVKNGDGFEIERGRRVGFTDVAFEHAAGVLGLVLADTDDEVGIETGGNELIADFRGITAFGITNDYPTF